MARPERFKVNVGDRAHDVELSPPAADGSVRAVVGEHSFVVTAAPDGSWSVQLESGARERVWLDRGLGRPKFASVQGEAADVLVQTAAEAALEAALLESGGGAGAAGAVKAPMPGRVVKALVAEGDEVAAGQPVIIVEAMKMENEVAAAGAGVVQRIVVSAGDTVDAGTLLVEIAPHDDA